MNLASQELQEELEAQHRDKKKALAKLQKVCERSITVKDARCGGILFKFQDQEARILVCVYRQGWSRKMDWGMWEKGFHCVGAAVRYQGRV